MKICSKCGKEDAVRTIENKDYCARCALILMQQIREMFSYNAERT